MKNMELGQILKIIFQSVCYRLKISKREGQFFSLRVNSYRFDKKLAENQDISCLWKALISKKFLSLNKKETQLLNIPPLIIFSGGFYMVKRWRSNADLDLLLLPGFL